MGAALDCFGNGHTEPFVEGRENESFGSRVEAWKMFPSDVSQDLDVFFVSLDQILDFGGATAGFSGENEGVIGKFALVFQGQESADEVADILSRFPGSDIEKIGRLDLVLR